MSGEKCFISRNYKARFSAAGKAKIDCEETLQNIGFRNLGLPRTTYTSTLPNFFLTLLGTCLGFTAPETRLHSGGAVPYQKVLRLHCPSRPAQAVPGHHPHS